MITIILFNNLKRISHKRQKIQNVEISDNKKIGVRQFR